MDQDEALEVYRRQAYEFYNAMRASHDASARLTAEYGKFLIVSLFTIHTGAIVGLLALVGNSGGSLSIVIKTVLGPLWFFVIGLSLCMLCAFTTWKNWYYLECQYNELASPKYLNDPNQFPWDQKTSFSCKIEIAYWLSILLGFLSFFCMIGGAALALLSFGEIGS
jgi:hypothetical protein